MTDGPILATVASDGSPAIEDRNPFSYDAFLTNAYKPGGMGVHFINLNLVSPVVDPAKPQGLLYEPHGGKLTLTGAEWFVPLATGVKKRPTLLGHPFNGPMMGHPPLLPMGLTHYDLHVWLYKPNPLGMFEPTNPDVKCTGEAYRVVEVAPMLVAEPKP